MRKRQIIDQNKVAANAFLSTCEDILDVDQVKRYVEIVQEKVNGKTNMFVGGFDVHEFLTRYSFAFCINRNFTYIYLLTDVKDGKTLKGLFREDLPEELLKIMKESGNILALESLKKPKEEKNKVYIKTK